MTALFAALILAAFPIVPLILVFVVLAFGIGVLLFSRMSARAKAPTKPSRPVPTRSPAKPAAGRAKPPSSPTPAPGRGVGTPVIEPEIEPGFAEPEPVGPELVEAPLEGTTEVYERPRFRDRIARARATLSGAITGIRGRAGITEDTWDDLEEALLRADVGVKVTDALLSDLRGRVKSKEITDPDQLLDALQADMKSRLEGSDRTLHLEDGPPGSPNVWLFVGVNGVGKTTTIGKVGAMQVRNGHTVLMAAGDTFRAAAAEQLQTWAHRAGAEFVRGNEGGDPSSVIFDGVQAASARGCELVLGDTAGRLHNKANLMEELKKVRRVASREPGRITEVLLVIDATTGQNGLTQAREFAIATEVTGVVLTKLDGSAKGGIVFAIETELGIPIKLVGLGETIGDLVDFDPDEFVDALFS